MHEQPLCIEALRINPDLPLPVYAKEGDAGLDLRSCIDVSLGPHERCIIPCGIAVAIPSGYAGLVMPRSGLGANHGITLANAVGLIDSGYRGELKVPLLNTDNKSTFQIKKGNRIAQLVIIQVPQIKLLEVDELNITSRGLEGFGSSGV